MKNNEMKKTCGNCANCQKIGGGDVYCATAYTMGGWSPWLWESEPACRFWKPEKNLKKNEKKA